MGPIIATLSEIVGPILEWGPFDTKGQDGINFIDTDELLSKSLAKIDENTSNK